MPRKIITSQIPNTIPPASARKYYDFWGRRYDWFGFFESRAKTRALELLDLSPGVSLLNVGIGTGKEFQDNADRMRTGGRFYGLDLSMEMLRVARDRSQPIVCQADGGNLPFGIGEFDRLYAAYVLDLVPTAELPLWLRGFQRVLRPGGRLVLLTLTEGVTAASRAFVKLWKAAYNLNPLACGGCRPLQLTNLVQQTGFSSTYSEIIVQFGIPSQVILAYS